MREIFSGKQNLNHLQCKGEPWLIGEILPDSAGGGFSLGQGNS